MEKIKWTTKIMKVSEIRNYDRNPRKITDKQMEQLKKSIDTYGYASTIMVNTTGEVIAGNMRLQAMRLLGIPEHAEIEVRYPSRELTKAEFRSLVVIDNKSGGGWDFDILNSDYEILDLVEFGFEPMELGLSVDDILEEQNQEASAEDPNPLIPKNIFELEFGSKEELDQFTWLVRCLDKQYSWLPYFGARLINHLTNTIQNIDTPHLVKTVDEQKLWNKELNERKKGTRNAPSNGENQKLDQ